MGIGAFPKLYRKIEKTRCSGTLLQRYVGEIQTYGLRCGNINITITIA